MRWKSIFLVIMCALGMAACGAGNDVSQDNMETEQTIVQQPQEA